MSLSVVFCLFVCLAAWLLPYSGHYICYCFCNFVNLDFVTQPLFSLIITRHFLFHIFVRPLGENSTH